MKIITKNKLPITHVGKPKKYALGPSWNNLGNSGTAKFNEYTTPINEMKSNFFEIICGLLLFKINNKDTKNNERNNINPI